MAGLFFDLSCDDNGDFIGKRAGWSTEFAAKAGNRNTGFPLRNFQDFPDAKKEPQTGQTAPFFSREY